MKILMILDSNADLHLARVFTAMQADVLVYSGDGMVGLEDDVFTPISEWRPYIHGADLVICDSPSLLFKIHTVGVDSPVLYSEGNMHNALDMSTRDVSPIALRLMLALIKQEHIDIPIENGSSKRRWWRPWVSA